MIPCDFVDYKSLYCTIDLITDDACAISGAWYRSKSGRYEFAVTFDKKCRPLFGVLWNAAEGHRETFNPDEIRAMLSPFWEPIVQTAIDAVYEW